MEKEVKKMSDMVDADEFAEIDKAALADKDAEINQINAKETSFSVAHNFMSTWTDFEYEQLLGFKHDWESHVAAKTGMLPAVVKICDRSTLITRPVETTARIARRGDWQVTAEMKQRGKHIFGGMGNEDILEDSLGKVRDAERRDGTSNGKLSTSSCSHA